MFHFTLIHVPADKHKGPDALSRRETAEGEEGDEEENDEWLDDIALYSEARQQLGPLQAYLHPTQKQVAILGPQELKRPQSEQVLHDIERFLRTLETPHMSTAQERQRFIKKATRYLLRANQLYKRNGSKPPLRVILDPKIRLKILTQAHDQLGHRGEYPVFHMLKERFYWPYMWNDVRQYIHSCHQCQIRSTRKTETPLMVSTPSTLFVKIYLDIMFMPKAKNFRYIIAARDDLSRAAEGRALKRATAKKVSQINLTYLGLPI